MKKFKYFILILSVIVIYFNYNYPFFIYESKGWSVGWRFIAKDSLLNFKISQNNILTSKYLNSLNQNKESIFLADPFVIEHNNKIYLFVENQIVNDNARIDLFTAEIGENFIYKGTVLDEDFHLSYPQVFKEGDKFYMIPEAKRSNNVLLYETQNFPYDWKIKDTLIKNVRYKDPTILSLLNKKLMFAVDDKLNLFVYESDKIEGPWNFKIKCTKLRGNEARGAGRIFSYKDKLYIPVQNLSKGYGTGVSLYAINFIEDKIEFIKEKHLFLKPQNKNKFFNKGMHHLDVLEFSNGYLVVYDGDEKNGNINFNWKRTIKYNLIDLGLY